MASLVEEVAASIDPAAVMRRVVDQTSVFVGAADGVAVCLWDGEDRLAVVATTGTLEPQQGRVVDAARTFGARALRSRRPEIVNDALADPRLSDEVRATGVTLGARSCVCIPLRHGETAIGVLTVVSHTPYAFDEVGVASLLAMSGVVSALIDTSAEMVRLLRDLLLDPGAAVADGPAARFVAGLVAPEVAERDRLRGDVDALVLPGAARAVFQPMVALHDLRVHGLEGLCRFPGRPGTRPDHWFSTAHRVGRGVDLELGALRAVLAAAVDVPARFPVGVNVGPVALVDPVVQRVLLDARRDLVVELTEHEPAPEVLASAVEPLRAAGLRLAVDDAGAGFAGLTRILSLRPDMLKLDRELTAGIESDPVRRALATSLVSFAHTIDAVTVAEGIETEAQYHVVRDLGIGLGQGFWFCPPRPLPELLPDLVDGCLPVADGRAS